MHLISCTRRKVWRRTMSATASPSSVSEQQFQNDWSQFAQEAIGDDFDIDLVRGSEEVSVLLSSASVCFGNMLSVTVGVCFHDSCTITCCHRCMVITSARAEGTGVGLVHHNGQMPPLTYSTSTRRATVSNKLCCPALWFVMIAQSCLPMLGNAVNHTIAEPERLWCRLH